MKTDNMINNQQTVLVIGGRGFIGRHIVKQLTLLGAKVIIGTRQRTKYDSESARQVILHEINHAKQWSEPLNGIDVVVNTVGILRERIGESYEKVHHQAVKTLAEACAQKSIRLVHISALGLNNPVKSHFIKSKLRGENALIDSQANWAIVRPSLVDGEGGFGAKWFRRVARWPLHIVPKNATGIFAPIDADDLGEAVARIALKAQEENGTNINRIYELGGDQRVTVVDYLNLLRSSNFKAEPFRLKVPAILARAISHIFDFIHFTPYSFGHYELLKYNNYPIRNRLQEVLGREAKIIGHCGLQDRLITAILNDEALRD